jgi:hypothetical protein
MMNIRESDFDQAFDATFGFVAYALNRHLVHHMLRCSRVLGVDFETLVVWGVLAHQNVAHLLARGRPPDEGAQQSGYISMHDDELRPLRLRDLQQITGIPRETLRRKLEELARRRFVRRADHGGWIIERSSLEPDLREFTRESARLFLECAAQIESKLAEAAVALPKSSPTASAGDPARAPAAATMMRSAPRHPRSCSTRNPR